MEPVQRVVGWQWRQLLGFRCGIMLEAGAIVLEKVQEGRGPWGRRERMSGN